MIEYSKDAAMLHLKENWDIVDSPVGFLGVNKIYEFYNHVLSIKVIKKNLSSFESHSLMSEVHKTSKQNVTIALHPRDAMQIDFFYVNEISQDNDGINYIFSAIDIFTKRGFCVPQIKCNANSAISSMKIILNFINVRPKSIICDPGSEFKNVKFKKYLDKIGIKMIFS